MNSLGNILYYCTLLHKICEHLHNLYTLNSISGWKGLTKFILKDCLNSTLIYILFSFNYTWVRHYTRTLFWYRHTTWLKEIAEQCRLRCSTLKGKDCKRAVLSCLWSAGNLVSWSNSFLFVCVQVYC